MSEKNPIFGLNSIPSDTRSIILSYLDVLNGSIFSMCFKTVYEEWRLVPEKRWNYFKKYNPVSHSINKYVEDEKYYAKAIHCYFENNKEEVLIIGGSFGGKSKNNVTHMIIDNKDNIHFEIKPPLLLASYLQDALYHQGNIYSINRYGSNKTRIEIFNILTQKIDTFTKEFPNNINNSCSVFLNNKLHVISPLCNIYTLQETGDYWEKHDLHTTQNQLFSATISFQSKIFLAGGVGVRGHINSVQSYDPKVGIWIRESNMVKYRSFFVLFEYKDELYAVGGENYQESTTIEKRNMTTLQWEVIADCGKNRYGCTSALVGSKVFLFGGLENMTTFDYYDLEKKKWASQDNECAYFSEEKRCLPPKVIFSKAVNITHCTRNK